MGGEIGRVDPRCRAPLSVPLDATSRPMKFESRACEAMKKNLTERPRHGRSARDRATHGIASPAEHDRNFVRDDFDVDVIASRIVRVPRCGGAPINCAGVTTVHQAS